MLGRNEVNICTVKDVDHYNLKYIKVDGHLPVHTVRPDGSLVFTLRSETETGEYRCSAETDLGTVSTIFYGKGLNSSEKVINCCLFQ